MKNIIYQKSLQAFLLIGFVMSIAVAVTSCDDDELENGGNPRVDYVRITNPASSDSLLVATFLGNLIAIMGENLGDVREVWFNDQKAVINQAYVSNQSVLVRVPNAAPKEVTNKMRLVFKGNKELVHDFFVIVPSPILTAMKSEYVNAGEVATLKGDYFFEPVTVMFSGDVPGEVVDVTQTEVQVRVPEGAQAGPVTLETNFGRAVSSFHFRDERNLIWSSEENPGWWWGGDKIVKSTDNGAFPVNGNYIRMKQSLSGGWTEMFGGPPNSLGSISKNIPDQAILESFRYNLKFEVNTQKPYNGALLRILFGNVGDEGGNEPWAESYKWAPPFDTKGKWETVTIPFEVVTATMKSLQVRPQGYGVKFWWWEGTGTCDCDISFDNVRVVPK